MSQTTVEKGKESCIMFGSALCDFHWSKQRLCHYKQTHNVKVCPKIEAVKA